MPSVGDGDRQRLRSNEMEMNVEFENLVLRRATVHSFEPAKDSINGIVPSLSGSVQQLEQEIRFQLQQSLVNALTAGRKTYEMVVGEGMESRAIDTISGMIGADDHQMLSGSKALAKSLVTVARAASLQNSVLLVAEGTIGVLNDPAVAVVMAQKHGAFQFHESTGLSLIKDLFLGGHQRINKVAILAYSTSIDSDGVVSKPEWKAAAYDEQNRTTAQYFSDRFLGLTLAPTGARFTSELLPVARSFMASAKFDPELKEKSERMILAEIWDSSSPTLDIRDVASRAFPSAFNDDFIDHALSHALPGHAFERDTSYMHRPRSTKRSFTSGITINIPLDLGDNALEVLAIENGYTTLRVKGTLK